MDNTPLSSSERAELEQLRRENKALSKSVQHLHYTNTHGEALKDCPAHLEDDVQRRMKAGLSRNQAIECALAQQACDGQSQKS